MAVKPPTAVALDESHPTTNILLYGAPGVGKTVFGGGRGGADLIISTEKDKGQSAKKLGGTGQIVICRTWDEFEAARAAWEDGFYGDPKWTLFDTATSIQSKLIDSILIREYKRFANDPTRRRDVLEIKDHQEYQNMTRRIFNEICDTPRNTIITAHEMWLGDPADDEAQLVPLIDGKQGAVSIYVASIMTAIGYMKPIRLKGSDDTTRRIYWQQRKPYITKDWTHSIGDHTDNVTLADLDRMINRPVPVSTAVASTAARSAAARRARTQ
jgi:AAA domain